MMTNHDRLTRRTPGTHLKADGKTSTRSHPWEMRFIEKMKKAGFDRATIDEKMNAARLRIEQGRSIKSIVEEFWKERKA